MPLTEEQRSMLQLLLEGGQSYDDIASLLGVSSDDVRSRVRAALREMGGADPDAQVLLSDYLLGKADPIGRADAVRHLQGDPEAHAMAQRLLGQLRLLAPTAELPDLPPPRGGRRPAPAPAPTGPEPVTAPGKSPLARVRTRLSPDGEGDPRRARMLAALGVAGLLVIAIVLVVVLGGDDGDDGDQAADSPDDELVIVQLAPVSGGSGATGQAVFAQTQDQPLLQLNLSGLSPAGKGNNYIVWLYASDQAAFPVARDRVNQNGNLTGAAPIPAELSSLVGQFGCVDVSLASNTETRRVLQQAVQGQSLPSHTGQSVLRGQIPAPGETAPSGADAICDQPVAGAEDTTTDPGALEGATTPESGAPAP